MPPEIALTNASPVDTSPYPAASGTSRRSTHGCWVNDRDTTNASTASDSPPSTSPVCTERDRRSQRPIAIPSSR